MRLTSKQINDIQTAAREVFSPAVNVRVFDSRLDDQRRGGDIDLLVEPAHTLLVCYAHWQSKLAH